MAIETRSPSTFAATYTNGNVSYADNSGGMGSCEASGGTWPDQLSSNITCESGGFSARTQTWTSVVVKYRISHIGRPGSLPASLMAGGVFVSSLSVTNTLSSVSISQAQFDSGLTVSIAVSAADGTEYDPNGKYSTATLSQLYVEGTYNPLAVITSWTLTGPATPSSTLWGQPLTLNGVFSNSTSGTVTHFDGTSTTTVTSSPVSGSNITSEYAYPAGANTYYLTLQPGSVQASQAITVLTPSCNPPTSSSSYLTVGSSMAFTGGGSTNLYNPSAVSWVRVNGSGTGTMSGNSLTGNTAGTVTVRNYYVANGNGALQVYAEKTITVVAAPSITDFQSGVGSYTGNTTAPNGTRVYFLGHWTGSSATITTIGTATSGAEYSLFPPSSTTTNYTLTVYNLAGASVTSTVSVTMYAPVVVTMSPTSASLAVSATRQFTATVTNSGNTTVTWSVDGGSANGTVSSSGLYTAPATAVSATVRATSNADPTKSATAAVTVYAAPSITDFQSGVGSYTGNTTAPNGTRVYFLGHWTGSSATITTIGTATSGAEYSLFPPSSTTTNYTLTVYNLAGASVTSTVSVTMYAPVVVTMSPTSASLAVSATRQFTATVTNSGNTTVTWSVDGGSANGTVSSSGLYTAPATAVSATVRATSNADPTKSATAAVTVYANPVITSFTSSVTGPLAGQTYKITPVYTGGTGSINQGVGALATNTASANITATQTAVVYTLTVTNPVSVTATQTLTVTPQTVSVAVTPTSVSLNRDVTQQFTASVSGALVTTVTWSVDGGSTNGTITTGGLYTPPAIPPGAITVRATSVPYPSVSGTASVVVNPITVTLGDSTTTIPTSGTFSTSATVTGSSNTAVTWSIFSGSGSISVGGLFTAPSSPGTTVIHATANADGTTYAACTVTVLDGPIISSFVATTTTPLFGDATTLTPSFTGGTASINQGVGTVSSGAGYSTGAMTTAKTFTLTVTNGITTATATLTITPTTISVTVTPAVYTAIPSEVKTFTASVLYAGSTSLGRVWSTSGGSIDPATGVWTAPAEDGVYIVTATSTADPSKSGSATVTVVRPVTSGKKSALASS